MFFWYLSIIVFSPYSQTLSTLLHFSGFIALPAVKWLKEVEIKYLDLVPSESGKPFSLSLELVLLLALDFCFSLQKIKETIYGYIKKKNIYLKSLEPDQHDSFWYWLGPDTFQNSKGFYLRMVVYTYLWYIHIHKIYPGISKYKNPNFQEVKQRGHVKH